MSNKSKEYKNIKQLLSKNLWIVVMLVAFAVGIFTSVSIKNSDSYKQKKLKEAIEVADAHDADRKSALKDAIESPDLDTKLKASAVAFLDMNIEGLVDEIEADVHDYSDIQMYDTSGQYYEYCFSVVGEFSSNAFEENSLESFGVMIGFKNKEDYYAGNAALLFMSSTYDDLYLNHMDPDSDPWL